MIGARRWPHRGAPQSVELRGATFVKVRGVAKPDVVAEYRENVKLRSAHVYVYRDGSYDLHHADTFNPEAGPVSLAAHAVADGGLWAWIKAVFSFRPNL